MKKKLIRARPVLEDIRSGASDLALMERYKLSSKELQILFKKLGDVGLLKNLNSSEVIGDIRSGLSDEDLMRKHGLSEKGLAALFAEVDRAGLLRRPTSQGTVPTKIVIHEQEIVQDIKSGIGRSELMEKYHLSLRALRWVIMSLVSSGALKWQEAYGKICSEGDELVAGQLRASKRLKLDFDAPIYEMNNPGMRGTIRDLNERGIGARGIKAEVGETKTLVIGGDEFGEYAAFALDALCRWVSKDPSGEYLAGFEISNISVAGMGEFQILIELVRIREQV